MPCRLRPFPCLVWAQSLRGDPLGFEVELCDLTTGTAGTSTPRWTLCPCTFLSRGMIPLVLREAADYNFFLIFLFLYHRSLWRHAAFRFSPGCCQVSTFTMKLASFFRPSFCSCIHSVSFQIALFFNYVFFSFAMSNESKVCANAALKLT